MEEVMLAVYPHVVCGAIQSCSLKPLLTSGSYTPWLRRDMNFTTQSASGPVTNAPMMAPMSGAIATKPTSETLKRYGGAVNTCAKMLPTTINQDVVKPYAKNENSTCGKISIISGLVSTFQYASSDWRP
jgi:hypothetical protein